jgi:hypothetical protein
MLTLIGISIFALAEFFFDHFAVGGSTNWSIYYFVSLYIAFAIISIDLFIKAEKSVEYTGMAFTIFFIVLAVYELTFINVPFDNYIVSVNENKLRILTIGLLCIALLFITLSAWGKRLWKT